METKNLTIIIIVAVVAIVVGGVLGMSMQSAKDASSVSMASKLQPAVKTLSSKVVPSIVAYGQVSDMQGRNITLNYGGDSITVPIAENSNVYSFVAPVAGSKTTTPTQQKVQFAEIKKGDSLNVSLKLLPDGTIQGQNVIILLSAKK